MAFQLNYTERNDLIPEGEYECRIERAMETATDRGTPYLSIVLRVRQDVDQPQGNRMIYHALWPKKTPDTADAAFAGYSAKQILALSEAAGLPAGRNYNGFEEWCEDLVGRLVRVTVYHDNYNGSTNARVRWVNETRCPDEAAAASAATAPAPGGYKPMPEDDDDVPF